MRTITTDSLVRLIVCAVGVGLLVSAFFLSWKHLLKIDVEPRQSALLGAVLIGLLAGFQFTRDFQLAAYISVVVVAGSFLLQWVMHRLGKSAR